MKKLLLILVVCALVFGVATSAQAGKHHDTNVSVNVGWGGWNGWPGPSYYGPPPCYSYIPIYGRPVYVSPPCYQRIYVHEVRVVRYKRYFYEENDGYFDY
jgi:hypothetical protein